MSPNINVLLAVAGCFILNLTLGREQSDEPAQGQDDKLPATLNNTNDKIAHLNNHEDIQKFEQRTNNSSNRCDLHNQLVSIAVTSQPPFVDCMQDSYGDWNCNGSNVEVIRVLEKRMNFRISWIVIANNHDPTLEMMLDGENDSQEARRRQKKRKQSSRLGGHQQQQQQEKQSEQSQKPGPSGIFSLVESGRVLMSANGVLKMAPLEGIVFNFTLSEPFDSFRLHFLLSKSVHDHDHIFLKPFTLNAWLAILASAALVTPIFYLLNTTSHYYHLEDDKQLHRLGLKPCLERMASEHASKTRELISCRTFSKRRLSSISSSSSGSDFDDELDKIMDEHQLARKLNLSSINGGDRDYSKHLPVVLQSRPVRGEAQRRRRLVRRHWAFERRRARRLGRKRRAMQRSGFSNLAYIIWYVVASLAYQGGETEDLPRANSTRMLVAFWWLYLIVISAMHSGILTAILTFPKQNDFIQTLDDYLNLELRDRSNLRITVDKFSEVAHLFSNPDNLHKSPLHQLVDWSRMRRDDNLKIQSPDNPPNKPPISYVNFQRHRQRILDEVQIGRAAFIEEKSTITKIITQEYYDSGQTKCLFKASRNPVDVIPMSLILSKSLSSECLELINLTLKRIYKTGLAQKWRRIYESPGNDCLNSVTINAGDVDKIELKHVILAFWLLSLGCFLGLILLVGEIIMLI